MDSRQIRLSDTFSSLYSISRSLRLLSFGSLELSDIVPRDQFIGICIKTFRKNSFTSNFYFSLILGETVTSLAEDSGIEKYTPLSF